MAGDNFDKGWVYVLHFDIPGKKSNFYKIGLTKNPVENRIAQLQTGNPFKIIEAHSFESECIGLLEGHLHKIFAKKRFRKEWFELTPSYFTKVKTEGKKFNDEFGPLAIELRELDKKTSIHNEMKPTPEHLKLHKKALQLKLKINEIELKKDIAKNHLRRLAGNTLGISGICEFYSLNQPDPSTKGKELKKIDLKEWEKWVVKKWKCDSKIVGAETKAKSHPKLNAELNELTSKTGAIFDINTYSQKIKPRTKISRQYHQTVIDCEEELGLLKVDLDLIMIRFKLDCKRRKGIEGVFKYTRGFTKNEFDKKAFAKGKPKKAYDPRWYYSAEPVPKFKVANAIGY